MLSNLLKPGKEFAGLLSTAGVTATNINFTNTTTSQHITLTLQIGVEYSFRVRGADTINRLGDWSDPFVYTPSK